MIWLSIVSLAVGALLASRLKIMALMPATLVVVAAGAQLAEIKDVWSILLIVGTASICIQSGYFVGMLLQHCTGTLLGRESSSFSDTTSARDSVR